MTEFTSPLALSRIGIRNEAIDGIAVCAVASSADVVPPVPLNLPEFITDITGFLTEHVAMRLTMISSEDSHPLRHDAETNRYSLNPYSQRAKELMNPLHKAVRMGNCFLAKSAIALLVCRSGIPDARSERRNLISFWNFEPGASLYTRVAGPVPQPLPFEDTERRTRRGAF